MAEKLLTSCPLPPGRLLVFIYVRSLVDPWVIARLEGSDELN
jgi:hypothetical protein